jgi:uncharacterized membrane protein
MSEEKLEKTVEKETGRIEACSAGVFAVAVTLLVFDLKAPQISAGSQFPITELLISARHKKKIIQSCWRQCGYSL